MKQFKRHRDYGFFDQDLRLTKLTKLGDPLDKLNKLIDFEAFRRLLEEKLVKNAKGAGGRNPYDYVSYRSQISQKLSLLLICI